MLYLIPTPIGNLSDISSRALEVLQSCEILICEDTRVSKKLLSLLSDKFQISFKISQFYSLHTHNEAEFFASFNAALLREKDCAYVSDAGMPCISDPGIALVKFAQRSGVPYEVLSGANALLLAAAASGLVEKEFSFLGFLNNDGAQRKAQILNLMQSPYPCILYESPKRVVKLIEQIAGIDAQRKIFAIKEATKKFETKFFGSAVEVLSSLNGANLNGEWCVVIDGAGEKSFEKITQEDILSLEIAPKIKAKLLSKINGEPAKEIYKNLIR